VQIDTDLEPLATRLPVPLERLPAPRARLARAKAHSPQVPEIKTFPPPPAVPAWARAHGRVGEGDPLFAAGAALALLDAHLRRDPPAAGALRARLALHSAATCAKILRLNADEGALRDLRFAVGDALGPAAKLVRLWRDLAHRPPSLDPGRLAAAAAALDLAAPNADVLAESLREQSRAGDPVSAAAQAAATAFEAFPDAPAAEAEALALWAFDSAVALRLRWPRPLPLIAGRILDPSLRSNGGGGGRGQETPVGRRRPPARSRSPPPRPSTSPPILPAAPTPFSPSRRNCGPNRRKESSSCCWPRIASPPAEAARHAPMTDRAARRLFDRLVSSSAAREFSGRPTFRLYGL
jgi:hypothetical protein